MKSPAYAGLCKTKQGGVPCPWWCSLAKSHASLHSDGCTGCEYLTRRHGCARVLVLAGVYIPSCDEDGYFRKVQCDQSRGECWCVDQHGGEMMGTRIHGNPDCGKKIRHRISFFPSSRIFSKYVIIFLKYINICRCSDILTSEFVRYYSCKQT